MKNQPEIANSTNVQKSKTFESDLSKTWRGNRPNIQKALERSDIAYFNILH